MAASPELGFYTLAGAPETPRALIGEVLEAEELGLGACFISERFNVKEAVTLCGAAGGSRHDGIGVDDHRMSGVRRSACVVGGVPTALDVAANAKAIISTRDLPSGDMVNLVSRTGTTIQSHESSTGLPEQNVIANRFRTARGC